MLVYIGMYISLFLVGFVDSINRRKKTLSFFFLILLLIFHDAFRWETGTDWENYYNAFQRCLLYSFEDFEIGYVFVMRTIRNITDNYTLFLLFHAIFVYTIIAYIIFKYSPMPTLSLFFLYGYMLPLLGMNRQYMALVICLFSVIFILKKSFLPFIICIGIASLFHKTAFLFLPAYYLNKDYSVKTYLYWIIICVIISFTGIIKLIPSNIIYLLYPEKYSSYIENIDIPLYSKLLGIIRKLIWVYFSIYLLKKVEKPKGFSLFFNLYFISVVGNLLLNGTLFQIIVARGLIYYSFFEVFVLTYIVSFCTKTTNKKTYLILIFFYLAIILYKNITYYTTEDYNCFIPYKSIIYE